MPLTSIEIWNYRSIKHTKIDLKNYVVLVGQNNSGKSNIMNAIDLVLGDRWLKFSEEDFFDFTQDIRLICNFENLKTPEIERIIPNIKKSYHSIAEYQTQLIDTSKLSLTLTITPDFQVKKSIFYDDLEATYVSQELKASIVTSVYIPSMRDPKELLKTYENAFFGKLLNKMYALSDSAKKDLLNVKLTDAQSTCEELFSTYETLLNDLTSEIIDHSGISFSFLPSNPKDLYKKLEILVDDGIKTGLELKGSGIQSVLLISLFTLYSRIKGDGNALLLIDEPELFLHPHANRHMARILGAISHEGAQIIMSTHSTQYLLNKDVTEIVLIRKNVSGNETFIKQVTSFPDQVKLRKELNNSNLELFFSNKVVLVEGPSDKIVLPCFALSFDPKNDFDKRNIGIINVGGKENLDVFILLLTAFNIPWLAICDNDFSDPNQTGRTLTRMNTTFHIGLDLEHDDRTTIENKLKNKNIFVLSQGEIENYYLKSGWKIFSLIELKHQGLILK
jgi:predicted ATP-dependent endonuclease of OLD family